MRTLATDGYMPSRAEWDANRGDFPSYAYLNQRRKWRQWAEAAGLKMRSRGGRREGRTLVIAPTAEPSSPARSHGAYVDPPSGHVRKAATSILLSAAERTALIDQARQTVQAIAPGGLMPRQRDYDLHRAEGAPHGGELLHLLGLPKWSDLADLLGMEYVK